MLNQPGQIDPQVSKGNVEMICNCEEQGHWLEAGLTAPHRYFAELHQSILVMGRDLHGETLKESKAKAAEV